MISNATPWMYEHALYNGVATQSLRFDDGSTSRLTRTPSSAGNRRTWTFSCWYKRSNLERQYLFGASANYFTIDPSGAGTGLEFYYYSGGYVFQVRTNAQFRDVSSWYHFVLEYDTTQATASNRVKIYVNGEQQTDLAVSSYPSQNAEYEVNNNVEQLLGINSADTIDGYMSEVNFVDGTALDPTSFGEFKNGVWIPIEYTGSYGTNGFRLQFNQTGTGTASASTIGADTSGNTNHWTSSGIVASDCNMPDSPENNFCTLNPLDTRSSFAISEANTKVVAQSVAGTSRSTIGMSTGKWYFEFIYTSLSGAGNSGITTQSHPLTSHVGSSAYGWSYRSTGQKYHNSTSTSYGATYTTGDVIGVAFDADNGDLVFYKNNASQGTAFTGLASDTYFASFGDADTVNASTVIANFGQDSSFAGNETAQGNTDGNGIGDFYYTPPSGFLALCSANLPEPTIGGISSTLPTDYFNTILWTGNATDDRSITGVGFQPDWTWVKKRAGNASAENHWLVDSNRGVTKHLSSNLSDGEFTFTNVIQAFESDGFQIGTDGKVNRNNDTYVGWNWKANGGTTSSNTDGSITSTVQANTTAGFSIVTYNIGSSGVKTVGHGLTKAPELIINKGRDSSSAWWTFTTVIDGTVDYLRLDDTTAKANDSLLSVPTSSVFSQVENYTLQQNVVSYCFHSVEGYSKIGTYTGNGSTDGAYVYTGFRPAWVIIKRTNSTGSWNIADSKRSPENEVDEQVQANLTNAESTSFDFDFTSNGFKARTTDSARNASGSTYIYMAFAEAPFKYANAR